MMRMFSFALAALLVLSPVAAVVYMGYAGTAPVEVTYHHPLFLSQPASNIADAKKYGITEARGNSQVFRYFEWCQSYAAQGLRSSNWTCDGKPSIALQSANTNGPVGCFAKSFALAVPPVVAQCYFQDTVEYQLNPLRSIRAIRPVIPLKILP